MTEKELERIYKLADKAPLSDEEVDEIVVLLRKKQASEGLDEHEEAWLHIGLQLQKGKFDDGPKKAGINSSKPN